MLLLFSAGAKMSSFPPRNWETRFMKDMDTYAPATPLNCKRFMAALLAVRPAEGSEGQFRFTLGGPELLVTKFTPASIMGPQAPEDIEILGEFTPGVQVRDSTCLECFV